MTTKAWPGEHEHRQEFEFEGPAFTALVDRFAAPGAMAASLRWYDENRGYTTAVGPVTVPTTVLWGDRDPTMPVAWADALADWFDDHELRVLAGVGHFTPLEAPAAFADAVAHRLAASRRAAG